MEATFELDGTTIRVGARAKGSSTWQSIHKKPAWKLKFDWSVDGQRYQDLQAVLLHNNRYDPTAMHEYLAYRVYREAGLPAPRTGFAWVVVNGEDYGLHTLVEQKDEVFLGRWFDDDTGSIYESGSFNFGCDLNDWPATADGSWCACFEEDTSGDGDSREDLERFCQVAANLPDDSLVDDLSQFMDVDAFFESMALDAILAHWDSYGGSIGNFHIHHEPATGTWSFSPYSVDLAWGWNPWDVAPSCGETRVDVGDYHAGYLLDRCFGIVPCKARLYGAYARMADHLESLPLGSWIQDADALIRDLVSLDTRDNDSMPQYEEEIACIRNWAQLRPEAVRGQLGL